MEAEDKCTRKGCTEKKQCGNYCFACYVLNEESPPPDEQNSKEANDQLGKEETLAAVNAAADEPQVEQTARQAPRANENGVVVEDANALLPPEHPKIFEQEPITSISLSSFGFCPTSENISVSQSVGIQDQVSDSTVESAGSVSRIEPEPSTSGYSGQKLKRKPNTDTKNAKKNTRANERKADKNQEKKTYWEGVCEECNGRECGNIYTHLYNHEKRAQKSDDQKEKDLLFKIKNIAGVKTLVRVRKADMPKENPLKLVKVFKCDMCPRSTRRKCNLEVHIIRKHLPAQKKTFKCKLCPKLFAWKLLLKEHFNRCHVIKWKCIDVCNRKMTRSLMNAHSKTNPTHQVIRL